MDSRKRARERSSSRESMQVDELVLLEFAKAAGADLDGRNPPVPVPERDLGVIDRGSDLDGPLLFVTRIGRGCDPGRGPIAGRVAALVVAAGRFGEQL